MRIAAFISSSSHNGNTSTAAKELLRGAESMGAETEIVYLNDYVIRSCLGCRVCERTNECVIKDDDMKMVNEVIDRADAYILGTPTYYGDITSSFKCFADRVYPYIDMKVDPVTKKYTFGSRIKERKPGVIICVSGTNGPECFDSHLKVGYFTLNDLNGYPWREIRIPGTSWTAVKDQTEVMETLFNTGKDLVEHMNSNEGENKKRTQRYFDRFRSEIGLDVFDPDDY